MLYNYGGVTIKVDKREMFDWLILSKDIYSHDL